MSRTTLMTEATRALGYVRVSTGMQARAEPGWTANAQPSGAKSTPRVATVEMFEDAGAGGPSVNGRPGAPCGPERARQRGG